MPAITNNKVTTGAYMGEGGFSTKNIIEDYMKTDYEPALQNEFSMIDALINKLKKEQLTGRKKVKSFALGITDNVRAMGNVADRYELGFDAFWNKGVETVEAEFDTTKIMATFSVTDESILKGTGDGSLFDVVKDSLNRMKLSLEHTMKRFTYGSVNGKIGALTGNITDFVITNSGSRPEYNRGAAHNLFYSAVNAMKFRMANSTSIVPGMGIMVETRTNTGGALTSAERYVGRVFQKATPSIHVEDIIMFVDHYYEATVVAGAITAWTEDSGYAHATDNAFTLVATSGAEATGLVYSRQLLDTDLGVAAEYHGLEDIVVTQNNTIFGVNRANYPQLNCTAHDLAGNYYVTEEILRDMSDHIIATAPESANFGLCAANPRIISSIEKALIQFKEYVAEKSGDVQLGRPGVKFDSYVLQKDQFARDNNLYMLDPGQIGELIRRDFTWITEGGEKEGVLQRRPGTEMYEGIMNKYGDMYIDSWRSHAVLKNCKVPAVGAAVSWYNAPTVIVAPEAGAVFATDEQA
jgi:hypothetical protein